MGNDASTGGGGGFGGGFNVSTNANNSAPRYTHQSAAPEPTPTWTYQQSTGILCTPDNVCSKLGYSGADEGINNPQLEHVPNLGPIPRGEYTINPSRTSTNTGPVAIDLTPIGPNPHNRTNLQIHGDSKKNPGNASKGCVILPRKVREDIDKSKVKTLKVIK